MIDGSEKRNRQLPFVFEKCCKWPQRWVKTVTAMKESTDTVVNYRWGRGLCEMRDFEIQTRDMCLPPPSLKVTSVMSGQRATILLLLKSRVH